MEGKIMIKLSIFNMEDFLEIVNKCSGTIELLHLNGKKEKINKKYSIQKELIQKHKENKNHTWLSLDIPISTKDYMNIIFFTIGDC